MPYRVFEESTIRGTILETVGPGLSARSRWMPCPPSILTMASMNTRMPMPPIQCEKLRQKRLHRFSTSTFGRMLEPVVVKPETISKTASRYDGISPQSVNGSAPANDSTTHPSATHRSPSRA